MNKLCIIPCGSAKIWDKNPLAGPTEAQFVYTGVFAAACQRYAKQFFTDWVILSAKYGFLFPNDIVPRTYNVSFINPTPEMITLEDLKIQAENRGLTAYDEITVLGGKHYVNRVQAIFNQGQEIVLPLSDCKGIGYMLQKLANSLEDHKQINVTASELVSTDKMKTYKNDVNLGKYSLLHTYLLTRDEETLVLSMSQIENILGFPLPSSAYKHRAWWANDITHSQAKAWLYANWEIIHVGLPDVTYRRTNVGLSNIRSD